MPTSGRHQGCRVGIIFSRTATRLLWTGFLPCIPNFQARGADILSCNTVDGRQWRLHGFGQTLHGIHLLILLLIRRGESAHVRHVKTTTSTLHPSRKIALVNTVAVVVPSPATSFVLDATYDTVLYSGGHQDTTCSPSFQTSRFLSLAVHYTIVDRDSQSEGVAVLSIIITVQ